MMASKKSDSTRSRTVAWLIGGTMVLAIGLVLSYAWPTLSAKFYLYRLRVAVIQQNQERAGDPWKMMAVHGPAVVTQVENLKSLGPTAIPPLINGLESEEYTVRSFSAQVLVDSEPRLSKRERDVLHLMCEGLNNKAISSDLKISDRTVEHHISNIFRKTGCVSDPVCHSRGHVIMFYLTK